MKMKQLQLLCTDQLLLILKAFYNQINVKKPNIDHPDVLEFYKLSQQNYPDLPELTPNDDVTIRGQIAS